MTFVNHTIGGFAVGSLISWLFGFTNYWAWTLSCTFIGAFPDVASWVLWQINPQYGRWWLYGLCHPPYDEKTKHGVIDKYLKWHPAWGLHTWVVDSIVHPFAPRFLFPKFPNEWTKITWVDTSVAGHKIHLTKWDIMYALLEGMLYGVYAVVIILTI